MATRLFVSNLPPYVTTAALRHHVESKVGIALTDCVVLTSPSGESRRIAFLGVRNHAEAVRAREYLDRSFVDTYRVAVSEAKAKGDAELERPWSKYSKGSSRFEKRSREGDGGSQKAAKKGKGTAGPAQEVFTEEERKDPKLREFLSLASAKGSARNHVWANDDGFLDDASADVAEDRAAAKAERKAERKARRETAKAAKNAEAAETAGGSGSAGDDDDAHDDADDGISDLEYLRRRQVSGGFDAAVATDGEVDEGGDDSGDGEGEGGGDDDDDDDDDGNDDELAVATPMATTHDGRGDDEALEESTRLLLQNLPYGAAETELQDFLAEAVAPAPTQVHLVVDSATGASRGFAFANFAEPEEARAALQQLTGAAFQGRALRACIARPRTIVTEAPAESDPRVRGMRFQDVRGRERRDAAVEGTDKATWNTLFVNSDMAAAAAAERLGATKADLLGDGGAASDAAPGGASAAVHVALAEAQVLEDTLAYFESEGVNVASLAAARGEAGRNANQTTTAQARSHNALLLKNLAPGVQESELRSLLEQHGPLARLVYPPGASGAPLAIAEYGESSDARRALRALCFRKLRASPLYLEWLPRAALEGAASRERSRTNVDSTAAVAPPQPMSNAAVPADAGPDAEGPRSRSVFVRNLAFSTDDDGLRAHATSMGSRRSARGGAPWASSVRAATVVKRQKPGTSTGKLLSAGFGFIELATPEDAARAARDLDGTVLDGHTLTVQVATGSDGRRTGGNHATAAASTKLVVRNVAFEATKKDLQQLFAAFGGCRMVRLPKRGDGRHKGYCFVEFATRSDAASARARATSLHLYGRPLAVEYAEAEEAEDAKQWRDASREQLAGAKGEKARVRAELEKRAKRDLRKGAEIESARDFTAL